MRGTPGFGAVRRYLETVGERFHILEYIRRFYFSFQLGLEDLFKIFGKIFADDKHDLAKTCADGVIDRVVDNRFSAGAKLLDLL